MAMKPLVVGCKEAVWGFALTGIQGVIVESSEELHRVFDEYLDDPGIGLLLITDDVAALDRERVDQLVRRSEHPLVVEIPGPRQSAGGQTSLSEMLRKTIGVRV
jgi:vacuolar-type H+-ATPase subunit F/Vma7